MLTAPVPVGTHAWPGHGEPVGVEVEPGDQLDVIGPVLVVPAGVDAGRAVGDGARAGAVAVPDALAPAVGFDRPLDLVRRARGPPHEGGWEPDRVGLRVGAVPSCVLVRRSSRRGAEVVIDVMEASSLFSPPSIGKELTSRSRSPYGGHASISSSCSRPKAGGTGCGTERACGHPRRGGTRQRRLPGHGLAGAQRPGTGEPRRPPPGPARGQGPRLPAQPRRPLARLWSLGCRRSRAPDRAPRPGSLRGQPGDRGGRVRHPPRSGADVVAGPGRAQPVDARRVPHRSGRRTGDLRRRVRAPSGSRTSSTGPTPRC